MERPELSGLLHRLVQQTRATHAELGEELSQEKAVDTVKAVLEEVWPEYLDREIRQALSLPVPRTAPEWQDGGEED